MTQTEKAREGILSPALKKAAAAEGLAPETLAERVARGLAVIPFNPVHAPARPAAIGQGLRTKVNFNLGTYLFWKSTVGVAFAFLLYLMLIAGLIRGDLFPRFVKTTLQGGGQYQSMQAFATMIRQARIRRMSVNGAAVDVPAEIIAR